MEFFDQVAYLLRRAIPDALDPVVERAVGTTLPRKGDRNRYAIPHMGAFSSRVAADLLAFGRNQRLSGALVVIDSDTLRVLFFRGGHVVGADTNVLFERLGRVLLRAGLVPEATARTMVEGEERAAIAAAAVTLTPDAVRAALAERATEVAAALFFVHHGHFLIVDGEPDLGDVPSIDLNPTDLALEGLCRYDEWRHGKMAPSKPKGVPAPTPDSPVPPPPPQGSPAERLLSESADELLRKVTDIE